MAAGQPDEDEFIELLWLPLHAAHAMVLSCEITHAKTVSALLRYCALRGAG